jgi:hypothetical protein
VTGRPRASEQRGQEGTGTVTADALGRQGMAFERLDQLALEYLYGVR